MLMALVERWNEDTCTFHLPIGEMTITLEDVHHILQVLIQGETICFLVDRSFQEMIYNMEYFLGGPVHDGMVRLQIALVMLLYLQAPLVAQIMMFTIALVLIPDGRGEHLEGRQVHMIRGMEKHRTMYTWERNILVHLYYDLGKFSFRDIDSMVHCMLLQVWCLEHITCTRLTGFPCTLAPRYPHEFNYPL